MDQLLYLKPIDVKVHLENLLDKFVFKEIDDVERAEEKASVLKETMRLLAWKVKVVRGEEPLFSSEDNVNEFNESNFSFEFNLAAFKAAKLYEDEARNAGKKKWKQQTLKELQAMIETEEVLIFKTLSLVRFFISFIHSFITVTLLVMLKFYF